MLYLKSFLIKPRCFSHMQLLFQCFNFHNSCMQLKSEKEMKFFNPYIKQYKQKIYKGYIEDHLMQTHKKSLFDIDGDDPDFEKSLLNEARRRKNCYRRRKKIETMSDKVVEMPAISTEQIQHIKFLHTDNPELWNPSYLAMSFGFTFDEIRLILKSRVQQPQSPEVSNFVNLSPTSNEIIPASKLLSISSPEPVNSNVSNVDKNYQWFSSFNDNQSKYNELVELDSLDQLEVVADEALYDEHHELFEYDSVEDGMDDEEDMEDEEDIDDEIEINKNVENFLKSDHETNILNEYDDEESLSVTSVDNQNFYDSKGRFLYRIP